MAEDDWDLYAVVRRSNSPATAEPPPPAPTDTASSEHTTLSSLVTLTFKEDSRPFSFSNLVPQPATTTHGFQELQQFFIPFTPTTTTPTIDQKHQQNLHKQELQVLVPQSSSAMNSPATQVQTLGSRKRKVKQKRMECHVTAENLLADLWAWRKYGQKPIKGSPYPRNYYRCSSFKGCSARKQVERSRTEADMFIVRYTGDHSHPPPTHRNSLAGSTRNKSCPTRNLPAHGSDLPSNSGVPGASFSASLSPTAASTSPPANEDAVVEPDCPSTDRELQAAASSDDDILIPNTAVMVQDVFLGMHQFSGGGGASPAGLSPAANDNISDNSRLNPG